MPCRTTFFEQDQPIHVLSRAVEGIKIFAEEDDCYRFILQIYTANIGHPSPNIRRRNVRKAAQNLLEGRNVYPKLVIRKHQPLVRVLDFALVVNHYHLCLVSNLKNGIPIFMQKLNTGFAKYFNLKYGRKGVLFGSRYKDIIVKTEFQLDALVRYINIINPLDVYEPGWRQEGLKDPISALVFLKNYVFSSFPDRIGERNAKILAPIEIRRKYSFGINPENQEEYLCFTKDFLKKRGIDSKERDIDSKERDIDPAQDFFLK